MILLLLLLVCVTGACKVSQCGDFVRFMSRCNATDKVFAGAKGAVVFLECDDSQPPTLAKVTLVSSRASDQQYNPTTLREDFHRIALNTSDEAVRWVATQFPRLVDVLALKEVRRYEWKTSADRSKLLMANAASNAPRLLFGVITSFVDCSICMGNIDIRLELQLQGNRTLSSVLKDEKPLLSEERVIGLAFSYLNDVAELCESGSLHPDPHSENIVQNRNGSRFSWIDFGGSTETILPKANTSDWNPSKRVIGVLADIAEYSFRNSYRLADRLANAAAAAIRKDRTDRSQQCSVLDRAFNSFVAGLKGTNRSYYRNILINVSTARLIRCINEDLGELEREIGQLREQNQEMDSRIGEQQQEIGQLREQNQEMDIRFREQQQEMDSRIRELERRFEDVPDWSEL